MSARRSRRWLENQVLCGMACLTNFARDIAVEAREYQVTVGEIACFAFPHFELGKIFRHWPCLLPSHSVFVKLPRRPR
jgi:hypothetical protein